MTDIWQHHRGVAIFTLCFTFPYPAPPSRVLSLVNASGFGIPATQIWQTRTPLLGVSTLLAQRWFVIVFVHSCSFRFARYSYLFRVLVTLECDHVHFSILVSWSNPVCLHNLSHTVLFVYTCREAFQVSNVVVLYEYKSPSVTKGSIFTNLTFNTSNLLDMHNLLTLIFTVDIN